MITVIQFLRQSGNDDRSFRSVAITRQRASLHTQMRCDTDQPHALVEAISKIR